MKVDLEGSSTLPNISLEGLDGEEWRRIIDSTNLHQYIGLGDRPLYTVCDICTSLF